MHRSIVGYFDWMDRTEAGDGEHGTHVAGSVLGNATPSGNTLSTFNGMAPKARVVFFDLKCTGSAGCDCPAGFPCECSSMPGGVCADANLHPPADLSSQYFEAMRRNGARVSNHSWYTGVFGTFGQYSANSLAIDQYAASNKVRGRDDVCAVR